MPLPHSDTSPTIARLPKFRAWLLSIVACCLVALSGNAAALQAAPPELRDGDVIVMIGGTFVEREGQFGEIETLLVAGLPDRKLTFRNLGWSGDTVWAESRGVFDPPAVGYQRLLDQVRELRPTVVVLNYGLNESYAGPAGLPAFVAQYDKLVNDIRQPFERPVATPPAATTTPEGQTAPAEPAAEPPKETVKLDVRFLFVTPPRLETPAPPLPDAAAHNGVLAEYVQAIRELAERQQSALVDLFAIPTSSKQPRTENGVHLTPRGYRLLSNAMGQAVGLPPAPIDEARREELRRKIVEKNTLYFHRWRPENTTYLFGFRKHEQGNNAVEIPQFDPLIAAAEAEIDRLKLPQ